MIPICTEWWCTEANVATQTHCYNPVTPAYPIWAYYAHGRQRRCQEDPVSLPSGRLEKTTKSSPHHVAQQRPTGSETTPPYAPRSSRFGSEPPSVEDDVDVRRYAIVRVACQKRRPCRVEKKLTNSSMQNAQISACTFLLLLSKAATCGVTVTWGCIHNSLSAGSGSLWNTSSIAWPSQSSLKQRHHQHNSVSALASTL